MKFRPARWLSLILIGFSALFAGCGPFLDRPLEEDKDPNFIDGRNKVMAMDYNGAVESFEKALLANPRNSAAHFELGWIFEQLRKYGAAVYHFEKFLELKPKSEKASTARMRITASIQEMAKSVAFVVIPSDVQKQIDGLTRTNSLLRTNVDQLRIALAARPQYVTNWFTNTVYVTNHVAVPVPSPVARASTNAPTRAPVSGAPATARATPPQQPAAVARPVAAPLPSVHRVQAGETLAAIAKRHGIPLNTLRALNPTVNAGSMRVGQELRLPPRPAAR